MIRDRRRTPARPDLAAQHLEGYVEAAAFAEATRKRVTVPVAPLTPRPEADAVLDTQLLFGESFDVYEERGLWAWGQAVADGYVGYIPQACLGAEGPPPTHRVTALTSHLYPRAEVKARPLAWLPLGAEIAVATAEGAFAGLEEGGFVPRAHLAPVAHAVSDWVAVAEGFLGVPYLWGGKAATGIDCSGLVQVAAAAAGLDAPRDSDMQSAELGRALSPGERGLRGDLIFWKGHVGILVGPQRLLHANAHHMVVVEEPLAEAQERILAHHGGPITGRQRIALPGDAA